MRRKIMRDGGECGAKTERDQSSNRWFLLSKINYIVLCSIVSFSTFIIKTINQKFKRTTKNYILNKQFLNEMKITNEVRKNETKCANVTFYSVSRRDGMRYWLSSYVVCFLLIIIFSSLSFLFFLSKIKLYNYYYYYDQHHYSFYFF